MKNTYKKITSVMISALILTASPCTVHSAEKYDNRGSFVFPTVKMISDSDTELLIPTLDFKGIEAVSDYEGLPSKYDMRSDYAVSSVKNQTGYGTCWQHSAAASAEASVIESEPTIDLSEFHGGFCSYYGFEQIDKSFESVKELMYYGGNIEIIANLWSQWIGPVYESYIPYGDEKFFESEENIESAMNRSDYHLRNAYIFDYDYDSDKKRINEEEVNGLVKKFVYEGKPVDVSYHHDAGKYYSYGNGSTYSRKRPRFANHSVAIVGWDDSYSADNFKIKPEHDGAWLAKNSWGENYGKDGYIWISYDEASLCEFGVFELDDKTEYKYNYQHDTYQKSVSNSPWDNNEDEPVYMAEVFDAEEEMQIEAVSIWNDYSGTDYEITICSGLSDGMNPISGEQSAITHYKADITGYITIELDEDIIVGENEKFSVVVKAYNENTNSLIPMESTVIVTDDKTGDMATLGDCTKYEQIVEMTGDGESFMSCDGKEWEDIGRAEYVYSDEEEKQLLDELYDLITDGIEPDETSLMENAEKLIESYRNEFEKGTVSVILGNIGIKAFGNPVGTVDFSHRCGEIPLDEKVSLSSKNGGSIYYKTSQDEEVKLYTEPISVESAVTIYASADGEKFISRDYKPSIAQFNTLKYYADSEMKTAQAKSEKSYFIHVDEDTESIRLYPISNAELVLNGEKLESGRKSDILKLENGRNEFIVSASEENKLSNEISITIIRGYEMGDVNGDFLIDAGDASDVHAHYAGLSTVGYGKITKGFEKYADMNGDGSIDASDASDILVCYAQLSTK